MAIWLVLRRWSIWTIRGSRWGGAASGTLTAVSIFAMQFVPVVPDEAGLAVGLLIVGVGTAMAGLGVELALEAVDRGRVGSSSDSVGRA